MTVRLPFLTEATLTLPDTKERADTVADIMVLIFLFRVNFRDNILRHRRGHLHLVMKSHPNLDRGWIRFPIIRFQDASTSPMNDHARWDRCPCIPRPTLTIGSISALSAKGGSHQLPLWLLTCSVHGVIVMRAHSQESRGRM